jgi:1-phosphofructokinase family hexose kinase
MALVQKHLGTGRRHFSPQPGKYAGRIFPVKNAKILTVTLNPSLDKTIVVPYLKIGDECRAGKINLCAGGKGINVSRALRCLGVKSVATGFLAGATGSCIEQQLLQEGAACDFLFIGGQSRTNLTIVDPYRKNKISRIIEQGPRVSLREVNRFYGKVESSIKYFQYLVISGSRISGVDDYFYGRLIRTAKNYGVKTALDASGIVLKSGLAAGPFMVKLNIEEAQEATGRKINSLKTIKEAARYFHAAGASIAAITAGSRGAMVFNGKEMVFAVPPRVFSKNFVGCGDAFLAGFLFSLSRKESLAVCAQTASACGAANVLSTIPGFIDRKEVRRLRDKVKLKKY